MALRPRAGRPKPRVRPVVSKNEPSSFTGHRSGALSTAFRGACARRPWRSPRGGRVPGPCWGPSARARRRVAQSSPAGVAESRSLRFRRAGHGRCGPAAPSAAPSKGVEGLSVFQHYGACSAHDFVFDQHRLPACGVRPRATPRPRPRPRSAWWAAWNAFAWRPRRTLSGGTLGRASASPRGRWPPGRWRNPARRTCRWTEPFFGRSNAKRVRVGYAAVVAARLQAGPGQITNRGRDPMTRGGAGHRRPRS